MSDPIPPDVPDESLSPHAARARRSIRDGLVQSWESVQDLVELADQSAREAERLGADLRAERQRRATDEQAAAAALRTLREERDRSAKDAERLSQALTEERAEVSARDRARDAALDQTRYERDEARAEAGQLRAQIDRLRAEPGRSAAEAPRSRPARDDATANAARRAESVPDADASTAGASGEEVPDVLGAATDATLASVFQAWCAAASPVVGKVAFFAGEAARTFPDATVAAVYRDANSQALPVTLRLSGGSSPVEHWLVAAEGRHWLLPQPLSGQQFRELAPCFEGAATPAALASVRPAEVRAVGAEFEVVRPGRVA